MIEISITKGEYQYRLFPKSRSTERRKNKHGARWAEWGKYDSYEQAKAALLALKGETVSTISVTEEFAVDHRDIREGGTFNFGDGRIIEVPPHSRRIYLEVWGNGFFDFLFYDEPQEDADPSDRIHMMIHGFDGERSGLLLNVEDGLAIIRGLTAGIQFAIAANVPVKPVGETPQ